MMVELNSDERRLIKIIASTQISCLNSLSNDDLVLICLEEELNPNDLMNLITERIERFSEIRAFPENMFEVLNEEDLSIVKHILSDLEGDEPIASNIWRKLFLYDNFSCMCHLN